MSCSESCGGTCCSLMAIQGKTAQEENVPTPDTALIEDMKEQLEQSQLQAEKDGLLILDLYEQLEDQKRNAEYWEEIAKGRIKTNLKLLLAESRMPAWEKFKQWLRHEWEATI